MLVSTCLFLLSDLSMRSLKIGSLNINGGRDSHERALISEVRGVRTRLMCCFYRRHILIQEIKQIGVYGGKVLVPLAVAQTLVQGLLSYLD